MPETSSSDHPHAATRRSKFLQNHPRASRALNIAPILSPPPLSKSSFSDLHSWKRIDLIKIITRPHVPPESHCNVSYALPAAHWSHLLTSSATSALVALLLMSSSDVIIKWDPVSAYVSLCWPLTIDLIGRWPLTESELTFCSPGAPYPVFRVDFIFAVYFCIFCF